MDKKILLVDDAAFMRMLIRNTLTTNGYTNILEAADGEIAVSTYSAEKPDLVIMDITMPNKTGIEALKEIKAMDPGAKVVMCSAMGQEAMVVEAIKLGALDFIVKPFKAERILQTVKKYLIDGIRTACMCAYRRTCTDFLFFWILRKVNKGILSVSGKRLKVLDRASLGGENRWLS